MRVRRRQQRLKLDLTRFNGATTALSSGRPANNSRFAEAPAASECKLPCVWNDSAGWKIDFKRRPLNSDARILSAPPPTGESMRGAFALICLSAGPKNVAAAILAARVAAS